MAADAKPFDVNEWMDKVSALKPKQTVEARQTFHPGFEELGLPGYLLFCCPICHHRRAISGEGKFLCICGTPLEIKRIA